MSDPKPVGGTELLRRAGVIACVLLRKGLNLAWQCAAGVARGDVRDRLGRWPADLVTALGPASVKAAQLLATRVDVLPPRLCAALGRLHDDVRPAPLAGPAELFAVRGVTPVRDRHGAPCPVAAGSIACVYRGTTADGRQVAVKVRRPGVVRALAVDLELMRRGARLAALLPPMRGIPVRAIVDQLCAAVLAQVDFRREARHLTAFRTNLAGVSALRVPVVHDELSDDEALVMEYVEELRRLGPEDLPEHVREQAVLSVLHGIYHMLFIDGLVHCDLHPGNVYVRPDGGVVLVDAGFTVRLNEDTREKFVAFFMRMAMGHGEACAQIVLSTTTPGPRADVAGFTREMTALVEANSRVPAADFDLARFAAGLFAIQRRNGLFADPNFVFPLLSLLVLEGTVRRFAPRIDFQREAGPFLQEGLFARIFAAHG